MDKRILVIIALVAIAEFTFTACVANGAFQHDDGYREEYIIYIGLNDSKTHVDYDPDEAAAVIDGIVLQYSGGLTRYLADGVYTYESDSIAHEKSLVYIVADLSIADVHKICDIVKEQFNQESIMISMAKGKVVFY